MSCTAKFTFIKGPLIGEAIAHTFSPDATVADLKHHLLHSHRVLDPDSQALVLVWEEQGLKLTDDALRVSTLGSSFSITVNIVKKATGLPPVAGIAPVSSAVRFAEDPTLQLSRSGAAQSTQPALSSAVKHGSRVRIEGLQAKPELNGRSGTVNGSFNEHSGRYTVQLDGNDASCHVSIRLANIQLLCESDPRTISSAVVGLDHAPSPVSSDCDTPVPSPAAAASAASPPVVPPATPAAIELKQGARVMITGLQAKPEMNDCTGYICDAFNPQSGRWTVQIDSATPSRGSFRPVNLQPIPALIQATQWLDEHGRQCPKNINYATQCPKGHVLAPFPHSQQQEQQAVICRMCHRLNAPLLLCSVKSCCGGYAVCASCADSVRHATAPPAAGHDLTAMGMSLQYLKWLQLTFGASLGRITTSQFEKMFLRPRTALRRCSVAHELATHETTSRYVGPATWFVSHTWSNPFADTLEAILNFFDGPGGGEPTAFLWFDVFVDSQHESDVTSLPVKSPAWYMTTFKSSINRIGNLLLVVDTWSDPTALKRAWCVLELHAIASKREEEKCGRFAIAMTQSEQMKFLQDLTMSPNVKKYYDMLGTVNLETSTCSRAADRESIHQSIRDTVGFAKLTRMVFDVLDDWIVGRLRFHINTVAQEMEVDGNDMLWCHFSNTLSIVLSQQGRHADSCLVSEGIVQHLKRKLETRAADSISRKLLHGQLQNLAANYGHLGRLSDALALQDDAVRLSQHSSQEKYQIDAISNQGVTFMKQGRLTDALPLLKQVLERRLQLLSDDDPLIGSAMYNLGNLYGKLGRHHEALELEEKALEFRKKILPENHPAIGDAMNNVAGTLCELGRYAEAIALFERTLEFRLRVLPGNHPDIASVRRNIALAKNRGGSARVPGAPFTHMNSDVEEMDGQMLRNHLEGRGALPPDVFEMPPHMVREMQSQMPPGMSQCPQQ